jgi:PleD family two-component response regulator
MIMQERYAPIATASYQRGATEPLLIGCPVCGRPAKVRPHLIGEELACGHCHGTFVVTEQMNGEKIARSITVARETSKQKSPVRSTQIRPSREQDKLPKSHQSRQSTPRPIAFIVEPRDEVYARLAGDLIEAGYRVVRALSATDALKACGKYRPKLVLAQLALPSQKAWQLAPKLAMLDCDTRVVLYGAEVAVHDYAMADFLGIEELVEYGGDLFRLSARIRQVLGSESPVQTESKYRSVA